MEKYIPRPEHPAPQRMRENWLNLNGEWEFEIDLANTGEERGILSKEHLNSKILVPFCPESSLSGVEYTDFMDAVWYKRTIDISEENLKGEVILHFGAVDYIATVFVNGENVGSHTGGYTSFEFDITKYLKAGENTLTVRAVDTPRNHRQPAGKQSCRYASYGCFYTRVTGIWQTVWLEFVPKKRIEYFKLTPDVSTTSVAVYVEANASGRLLAECFYEGKKVGEREVNIKGRNASFEIALSEEHLWEIGEGRLYDIRFTFEDDVVNSYFGLRDIHFDGMKFMLNGKSVFQRLVLDQGYFKDGIYTAETDELLVRDIKLSQAMGFNGARLHEKVFEERYLYHCDRMGYIVWGEFPNWGFDVSAPEIFHVVNHEWLEELRRDYNHPSIVCWCPFNETWDFFGKKQYDATISGIYEITKAVDPTRPCVDTSGHYHVKTDIFCVHNYSQDAEELRRDYGKLASEGTIADCYSERQQYKGEPLMVSEYGGIGWNMNSEAWSYGNAPKEEKEFLDRFAALTDALMENEAIFGLCYTQLYDVEQEMNGLYTYDREPKFPPEIFKETLSKKAAIED